MSTFKPPRNPPSQRGHLERLIDQYARANGVAVDRTRRWLSMMALIGTLETATLDEQPRFLIKGGVSIELRLGLRARSTKDVDAVFRGASDELIDVLEEAFDHPYGNFSFRRKGEIERIRDIQNLGPVREACVEIFTARATHVWPPRLHIPESWRQPFARLADEHHFPISDVDAAAEEVRELIAAIAATTRPVGQVNPRDSLGPADAG